MSLSDLKSKAERDVYGRLMTGESLFTSTVGTPYTAGSASPHAPTTRVSASVALRFIRDGIVRQVDSHFNGVLTEYRVPRRDD